MSLVDVARLVVAAYTEAAGEVLKRVADVVDPDGAPCGCRTTSEDV